MKDIKTNSPLRVIVDKKNHIILTYEAKIKKYTPEGDLIWEKDFDSKLKKKTSQIHSDYCK